MEESVFDIALRYYTGKGVEQDYGKALQLFEKSAEEEECAEAANNVGFMHFCGLGTQKNDTLAAKWFKKAAEMGDLFAMFNLYHLYRYGLGVEKNPKEQVKWLERALSYPEGFLLNEALQKGIYTLPLINFSREGEEIEVSPQDHVENDDQQEKENEDDF